MAILEMMDLTREEQMDKRESLIEEFGLEKVRKSKGDTLSGGERRRTEIARSLASDPKFILLDEPFAGVDAATERAILEVLHRTRESGRTLVVVHHDLATAAEYFDQIILLKQRLYAYGPPHVVLEPTLLAEVYEGTVRAFSQIETRG